jgi:hypothetical protein
MMTRDLISLIVLVFMIDVQGQVLMNNSAIITNTTSIHVRGGITNAGSGLLFNNGTISLTSDLTHDAANDCFGTSQGIVVMEGTTQSIGGNYVPVFNDLHLFNAAVKTLNVNIEVGGTYAAPAGVLKLNDALLDMNGHDLIVRNPDPSALQRTTGLIASERDPLAGHSFIRWQIGQAPPGYIFTFPFGNIGSGHYLPVDLQIANAGIGSSGSIGIATYPTLTTATPNNRPLPTGMLALNDVTGGENAPKVLDRWWILENTHYTDPPFADIMFSYRDGEWNTGTNTIMESALQLEREQNVWTMFPTVTNITGNTLSTTGIPLTNSNWTAAEIGSPLPIELLEFIAEISGDQVSCRWITASERDNDHFVIERSSDGSNFLSIGEVNAVGNSLQASNYEFIDGSPLEGWSYYRLQQVDIDGTNTFSAVVPVRRAIDQQEIVIHPNPCSDILYIADALPLEGRVEIFDSTGRIVMSAEGADINGLDVSQLPTGAYTLHRSINGERRSARFLKVD